jgi:hypothetical protein
MERMKTKKSSHSQAVQSERFKEAARELGCDEDEAAFKAKLAVIARQKPQATKKDKI